MTIRLKLTGGACKHYEKSFRWYRFPCCGGCYPCPICHLESGNCDKAKNGEDVLANQMICGNCSDQMGYSESKPCRNCGFEFGLGKLLECATGKGALLIRSKGSIFNKNL